MNEHYKMIIDFDETRDIENTIENWAERCQFKEIVNSTDANINDITYCFGLNEGKSKTMLTINILDKKVHLETWVVSSIEENKLSKERIDELLKELDKYDKNVRGKA